MYTDTTITVVAAVSSVLPINTWAQERTVGEVILLVETLGYYIVEEHLEQLLIGVVWRNACKFVSCNE
jgi:hypothetical protein